MELRIGRSLAVLEVSRPDPPIPPLDDPPGALAPLEAVLVARPTHVVELTPRRVGPVERRVDRVGIAAGDARLEVELDEGRAEIVLGAGELR